MYVHAKNRINGLMAAWARTPLSATSSDGKWLLKIATNVVCVLRFLQIEGLEVRTKLAFLHLPLLQAFGMWDSLSFGLYMLQKSL